MKLIAGFILFATITAHAVNSYSQTTRLNIHLQNATIVDIFREIERNSEFGFFFKSEELNLDKRQSVNVADATIDNILKNVLDKNYSYKILDKNIVVTKGNLDALQQKGNKVTGKVSDQAGAPLPGVSIIVKGTLNGVTTDPDGKYVLSNVPSDATLVFSFLGMTPKEIVYKGQLTLNVTLQDNVIGLDEVVVIGYGSSKKKDLVGAVDQIQTSAIKSRPITNVTQALQGASANLIVQQRSTEPGAGMNINIRGISTMNNNSPLVVIDGLVGGDINLLNPSDIENISVLKDAGSSAIYGSRSSNGVILITTKKGRKNSAPAVTFNTQAGIQSPDFLYEPVKGFENAILRNQALVNAGSAPLYTPQQIRKMYDMGDNEWFLKTILQNSMQQNYNFSISGGNDNTTYMISGGYMDQASNLVGPNYGMKRYNFRMNMTNEYGKLKFTTIMAYARTNVRNHTSSTGTLIVDAGRIPAYYNYSMKDDKGRYLVNDVLTEFNPLGILEQGGVYQADNDNLTGNISAELSIVNGLKLKGVFGGDISANHSLNKIKQVYFYASPEATQYSGTAGANRNTNDDNSKAVFLNSQVMLDFDKEFNKVHHVNALLGVSNESYTSQSNGIREKLTDPDLNIPVTGTVIETGTYTTPQSTNERSLNSLFGRAGYTFKDKYLFEFNFRYDGSSKFNKDNRWGLFPSASAGWRLTEEDFLASYKKDIGSLKLRTSYGILGNQNVSDYQYQTTYFVFSNAYGFNNTPTSGTGFTFANTDLRWEKSANFNVGLDATYFKNKLMVSLDYFSKLTSDILIPPAIPGTYGGAVPTYNAGEMRNQGWEVSVNYRIDNKDWRHSFNFNIADSWNKVVAFDGKEQITGADQMQRILREGLAFSSYLGYKRDGYFQNIDEVKNGAKPIGSTVVPGDIRYKDKNNDGVIDDNDRYVLGNAFPRYTFGFRYELGWKNFDFGIFAQGVGKRDMFLRGELVEPFHSNYSYVIYQHQLDFWTPVNPNAKYPRLAAPGSASNSNNFGKSSDLYIFDASYLRIKNIQLGYTLPTALSKKVGIEKLRMYVNAQNVFTLSNVSFINPESTEFDSNMSNNGANSGRNYPALKYYGFGLDINF